MLAFVMMASVPLVAPPPALAATGVLSMETPLHDAPDPGAAVIALLPEGTVVSIDGAPIDGFFEGVMVMSKDDAEKNRRLALLAETRRLFDRLYDLSRIVVEG